MPKKTNRRASEGLKLLGATVDTIPATPGVDVLETFANAFAKRDYWIRFTSLDFTSLCPVTGQPDFAHITIDYVADRLCIETKSLKFYLAAFRNTRSFNEEVVNRILDDLVAACSPRKMFVYGEFSARGGISVSVEAFHPPGAEAAGRPPQRGV